MEQENRAISAPDPATPEFDAWVKGELGIGGGTFPQDASASKRVAVVLATVRYALRHYRLTPDLVPSVWTCVREVQTATAALRRAKFGWAPGCGVRASVIQDATDDLERLRDSAAVPAHVGAAAIGIRNALGWTVGVVGLRSEKLVPRDHDAARSSLGGQNRRKTLHADYEDWRAIGKDFLKQDPTLTRKELAEKIRVHLKKTNSQAYDATFRTRAENRSADPDRVRSYKQSLDERAFNRIYIHIGPLYGARTPARKKSPRRV